MPVPAFYTTDMLHTCNLVEKLKNHLVNFILHPKDWLEPPKYDLNWKTVKFGTSTIDDVPEKTGIYAFAIKCANGTAPQNSYIMYIGMTGEETASDKRHLRVRYKEYVTRATKRPLVFDLIYKWNDHLYFMFAEIDKTTTRIEDVETYLLDMLIPPCNTDDFSRTLKPAVTIAYRGV